MTKEKMDYICEIRDILKKLANVDDKFIDKWMETPIPIFSLETPRDIIEKGEGEKIVSHLIKMLPVLPKSVDNLKDKK